jgi:O-antigen/teichoic acid export membrane protein
MVIKLLPEKAQILVKSRLISGGIWAVGGKVFVLPLGLLISALLTRVLSPDDMGAYIFAQSIVAHAQRGRNRRGRRGSRADD